MSKIIYLRFIPFALLLLSLVGFADAAYLTQHYYSGLALGCVAIGGCETVTTSKYATIGNTPVALLGAGYYLFVFALIAGYFVLAGGTGERRSKTAHLLLDFAARFTVVGFIVSMWLVYLQLFVIKSICTYCMISAATSTLLLIASGIFLRIKARFLSEEKVVI